MLLISQNKIKKSILDKGSLRKHCISYFKDFSGMHGSHHDGNNCCTELLLHVLKPVTTAINQVPEPT